jgi:hypothetical protein
MTSDNEAGLVAIGLASSSSFHSGRTLLEGETSLLGSAVQVLSSSSDLISSWRAAVHAGEENASSRESGSLLARLVATNT